jgi:ferrous iron transport protein A
MLTLEQVVPGGSVVVGKVGGARSFRRRLMELGIIPGTRVEVLRVAPFGDPMELSARGCNLSIRATEAAQVEVEWASDAAAVSSAPVAAAAVVPAPAVRAPAAPGCAACGSVSAPLDVRVRPAALGTPKSVMPKSVGPVAVVGLAKSVP